MNTKTLDIILVAVFLFELAAAKRVMHHETIIRPNGDRIEHSWSTDEANETELNTNKNVAPNVPEDGKDGADEHIFITSGLGKPGYHKVKTNLERDMQTKTKEQQPKPETTLSEAEQKRKSLLDFALHINSFFQPIDSIYEPWQTQPKLPDTFRHTHKIFSTPTQFTSTDIYSGPRTVFTGNWADLLRARPRQQEVSGLPNHVGFEGTIQSPEYNYNKNAIPNVATQYAYQLI